MINTYFEEEKEDIFISNEVGRKKIKKYSIEICINTERRKAYLQREALTLHTTSSNNSLTSNLKEFPKNFFPCKSKLDVLWNI